MGIAVEKVGGDHVGLRRAVLVVERDPRPIGEDLTQGVVDPELFAGGDHLGQRRRQAIAVTSDLDEAAQCDEREEQSLDPQLVEQLEELAGVAAPLVGNHEELATGRQRRSDLLE